MTDERLADSAQWMAGNGESFGAAGKVVKPVSQLDLFPADSDGSRLVSRKTQKPRWESIPSEGFLSRKETRVDFWEVIRRRHSVRQYDPEAEVLPEQVTRLLEAAVEAPSAGNCQPWHFVVVRGQGVRRGLARAAYGQEFLAQAPVVIAVCSDPARSAARYGGRGAGLYCLQDTAAAAEHILLAATALGLGSCWVGAFDEAAAARALVLPSHLRPVALISVGHSLIPSSRTTSRRSLDKVVSHR